MTGERIRLGQIGYGYWGQKLHRYFTSHPGFELTKVAVRDAAKERGKAAIRLTTAEDVLTDRNIQAVIVATPVATHFELAGKVLAAGKHLFCEKTFTETAAEAERLKVLADSQGLKIMVDFTFTFSRGVRNMVAAARSGQIGSLVSASFEMGQPGRLKPEGVYLTLGSHMLSILNMLAPLHEFSFSSSDTSTQKGVAESGLIFFTHNSLPFNGLMILNLHSPDKTRKIEIYGSRGAAGYDMFSAPGEQDNLAQAAEAFYQMIAQGGPSNVDCALEVAFALDKLRPSKL
ncbi:MAG: Gfo/Idh/MocA family oxidoreductase [Candidatus Saganbacteria bacterium]|nr:Gfo/Idh/MocA family oxidoreductase [Candidatus Saganbacteria bacterium]